MALRTERELVLRPMQPSDLDPVMAIERLAHGSPWSPDLMRREMEHEWSTILVGVETEALGGERSFAALAGYVIFWLVHDEVHILNLATHPERRRRGVGRALLLAAEESGRGRGAVRSTLEVRRSNVPAIGLYEQLGYRQVGMRPRYYADNGEDALLMAKELVQP